MITLDSILLEADKVKADEPDEGAEGNDTDTATEVQIFLSVGIVKIHALSMIKDHRETIVYVKQMGFGVCDIFFFCHITPPNKTADLRLLKSLYRYLCW